jgi:hypothetical protein
MHNGAGTWQGNFRVGYLDLVAHRYALEASPGTDALMVTHLDRLQHRVLDPLKVCTGYRLPDNAADAGNYFVLDGAGIATAIRLPVRGDRHFQLRQAELLMSSTSVYRTVSALSDTSEIRERKLLEIMQDSLDVPIHHTSHGPTAADKQALIAC